MTMSDDGPGVQPPEEQLPTEEPSAGERPPATEEPSAEERPSAAEEPSAGERPSAAEESSAEGGPSPGEQPAEGPPSREEEPAAAQEPADEDEEDEEEEPKPRVKPAVPGEHLEVDIVPEGADPLGREETADPYAVEYGEEPIEEESTAEAVEEPGELAEPIASATIDLAAHARYHATGKRKTAIARVTLRPGGGSYLVNGRELDAYFPRETLQRNIRQPLETVGYQERMDVVARLHGGGISAQAGALRHGISRALLEADPNLRGELKRRGFLTRDSRAKERKKAGLKKARKRPQFSKR